MIEESLLNDFFLPRLNGNVEKLVEKQNITQEKRALSPSFHNLKKLFDSLIKINKDYKICLPLLQDNKISEINDYISYKNSLFIHNRTIGVYKKPLLYSIL